MYEYIQIKEYIYSKMNYSIIFHLAGCAEFEFPYS